MLKAIFCIPYKYFLLSLIVFHFGAVRAGIDFDNISLNKAIEKAEPEKKLIFIDTYATWCAPCKVMDKVFDKTSVSDFFNTNFINVKIDMDGLHGPEMAHQYEVVWLPTLLILDHQGNILTKIDRLVSEEELLELAGEAIKGKGHKSNSSSLNNNPFPNSSGSTNTTDFDPSSKEEVIYVHDERESSGRPHIMYHEAYLHLQLMDGKHQKVVKKYLSTQQDWSTEKNVKFIFDFLQHVNSPQFEYFIENKEMFEEVLGKEKVERSLVMLVNNRLEQGYPRPSLSEAEDLYRQLSPERAKTLAYRYYLRTQLNDNRPLEYINTAEEYIEAVNPYDHEVMYQLVTLRLNRSDYREYLSYGLELMTLANVLAEENPEYLYTIAKIHYHLGQKDEALDAVIRSIDLCTQQKRNLDLYQQLRKQIEAL